MSSTNKMIIIAGLFLVSGCQQLQSGIDSSIQSLNQKLSPNSNDKKIYKSEDFATAQRLNGLKEICTDYTNNQNFAEKKWSGKPSLLRMAKSSELQNLTVQKLWVLMCMASMEFFSKPVILTNVWQDYTFNIILV